MFKKLLTVLFVFTFFSLGAQAETKKINIGMGYTHSYAPWLFGVREQFPAVAKSMGIDAEIVLHNHKSSVQTWPLLLSGQLDAIVSSATTLSVYNSKKPNDVKAISMMNGGDFFFVCNPSIKSIKDLKKDTPIAITNRRTHNHLALAYFGEKWFKNVNHFEKQIITPNTQQLLQVAASKSNEIGCAIWGSPVQRELIVTHGWNILGKTEDFKGLMNVFLVKKEWADKNEVLAKALLKTYLNVSRDFQVNPAKYTELYVRYSGVKRDPKLLAKFYAVDGYQGFTEIPAGLDKYLRTALKVKFIDSLGYKNGTHELFWRPELIK